MRPLFGRWMATGLAVMLCGTAASDVGAGLRIVRVDELGPMEQPAGIVGRDGGVSGVFAGRSVWVYGDSVTTRPGSYGSTWRNNTMSWTSDLDASDGIGGFVQPVDATGAAREFFPRTAEEDAFNEAHLDDGDCVEPCGARWAIWGSGPVMDHARRRALLAYGKVHAEPGEWNFHYVGTSIAVWTDFDTGPIRPEVDSSLDDPTLLFDASEGEFGIPAIDGEYLYLFSCSRRGDDSRGCTLARAPLDDVFTRASWRFRTAGDWTRDVGEAAPLFDGSPNMTVHWNGYLGRWLATYIDWGTIKMRTAENIEGPWSEPLKVFTPEADGAIHALAHAEYSQDGGAVEFISYLVPEGFRLIRVQVEKK